MSISNVEIQTNLLSPGHLESWKRHKKLVRSYEEICESEINSANPILKGHTNSVTGLALTSDNSFLLSCGKDNTLKVWSLIDRALENSFVVSLGQNEFISSMALSSSNNFVILVISDKDLYYRPLSPPGEVKILLKGSSFHIKSLSISSNNQHFCTIDDNKMINLYNLTETEMKPVSRRYEEAEMTFVLFADESSVIVGDKNGRIAKWNFLTDRFGIVFELKTSFPTVGVLYEDNRFLALGNNDGEVIVLDLNSALKKNVSESSEKPDLDLNSEALEQNEKDIVFNSLELSKKETVNNETFFIINTDTTSAINGISYSKNSKKQTIVISNQSKELIFIDLAERKVIRSFVRHLEAITSVLQTKDGKLVISASHDKLIKIWQRGEYRELKSLKTFGKDIKSSFIDKSSSTIAIAYNDSETVKTFSMVDKKEIKTLSWKGQSVITAVWGDNKEQLITANSTPEIAVYSYREKTVEFTMPCDSIMNSLVYLSGTNILYGCSRKEKIIAWNLNQKRRDRDLELESEKIPVNCVIALSSDKTKLYSGGISVIAVWNLSSRSVEAILNEHTSELVCLLPLSDGKTLISAGNDGNIIFWNLEKNSLEEKINEGLDWARAMDLFKEEKLLVVVHDTSKVTIINVENKKIEDSFSVSSQYCCKVVNDTTLIMAGVNSIRFYNLADKSEQKEIPAHKGIIYSLLIHESTDTLISFSDDIWIKRWSISSQTETDTFQSYYGKICNLCLTSDYLCIATDQGNLLIYSNSSYNEIKSLSVHNSIVTNLDYSSGHFATSSNDGKVGIIWLDFSINYVEGLSDSIQRIKFSHDAKLIFIADNKVIIAYNIEKKIIEYRLKGHEGNISSICVFPSGKYLGSGCDNNQVKLWNLTTRKEQNSFENHSGHVKDLCISDNESILFTGSVNSTIEVIDLNIKKYMCSLTGHSSSIINLDIYNGTLYSTSSDGVKNWLINEKAEFFSYHWDTDYPYHITVSPNRNYLAAAFNLGTVKVYDFSESKYFEPIQPFGSNISRIAFTEDSKSLVLASADRGILIWDFKIKKTHEFPAAKTETRNIVFSHDFSIFATFSNEFKAFIWTWSNKTKTENFFEYESDSQVMIFSHDKNFLFVGTDNGSVYKSELQTKKNEKFSAHNGTVRGLVFANKKKLLISGAHDRLVCFYDLDNNEIKTVGKHMDWIRAMAITSNEEFAISAGDDKVLIIWNLETKDESFRLDGHSNYIYGLALKNENDEICSCGGDKAIIQWSITEKKKIKHLRFYSGSIYCIVIKSDGKRVYASSDENTINVFDLSLKTEVACLSDNTKTVCDLALSKSESLLASGSWDNSVRVYKTDDLSIKAEFKDAHTDYVRSVAFSMDEKYVISGSDDRSIIFRNIESGQKELTLEGHTNYIFSVRFTSEDRYLISASRDETIKLWDMASRSEYFTFAGHTGAVRCLAVFNQSEAFISGGEDGLIKTWLITEKREDYTLIGHTQTVTAVTLTSDNLRLISGSDDAKINIWNLEKKTVELSLPGNTSSILAVNITRDGSNILTAGNDKTLKIWKMSDHGESRVNNSSRKSYIHVHTPDDNFELKYYCGRLSGEVKKVLNSSKLEIAITDVYDPHYQNLLKFYNLIDNIQEGQFDKLLSSSEIVFSKFLYTALHILANIGNFKILSKMFSATLQFKTDYFGKSPLYYAIVKQNQDCVDMLLTFLIQLHEQNGMSKVQSSFSAISKDLPKIIRNSSKKLHILLRCCLVSTNLDFVKTEARLPMYMFNSNFMPITSDFVKETNTGIESIPVIMMYTPFTLPCKIGSQESIDFLASIIDCSNKNIYNTYFIKYLLQYQWDKLILWVFGYAFLLWFNLALLLVLFTEQGKIADSWALPIFFIVNFFLMIWEWIQLYMKGVWGYFNEPWNVVDFFRFWFSMVWVVLRILEENKPEYRILPWIVALLNFTRGLTGFRLFDGTRYYVRLIMRALKDMLNFIVMLTYSTFTFGVMFQVARYDEYFVFRSLWMDSYTLNFGNFDAQDDYKFSYEAITYILATVINVILMLNLLISILGDSFEKFQDEKVMIDYSEKASVILEIQTMLFCIGSNTENQYFHVICSSGENIEEQTNDEKIDGIGTDLTNLNRNQIEMNKELTNQISNLETEVKEKISLIEGKIIGIEDKFKDFHQTLNNIFDLVKKNPEEKKDINLIDS